LTTASSSLDELRQVNLMLTNDLDASRQGLVTLSNHILRLQPFALRHQSHAQASQYQITSLEAQNQALDKRARR